MRLKFGHLLCLALAVAAFRALPSDASPRPARNAVARGHAFAQATCGGCHAIGRSGHSSYSDAPPFAAIVNHEGLTRETLSTWLRGAHNFPREMDFYLNDEHVRALVAYMLTLRDPHYRRPPD
jgi:mono/diheme cytochrome c family protein